MALPRPTWFGLFVIAIGFALIYILRHQRLTPGDPDLWIHVLLALLATSLLAAGFGILASWRTSHVLLVAALTPVGVFIAALLKSAMQRG